jgi:hypothetical protein
MPPKYEQRIQATTQVHMYLEKREQGRCEAIAFHHPAFYRYSEKVRKDRKL